MRSRRLRAAAGTLAAAALAAGGLVGMPTGAAGQTTNPFERGPAPTAASVTAQRGPFAFTQQAVTGSVALGFNRGTIYYPTATNQGTFGAVAVSPGFVSGEFLIAWLGPFLASNGFVVMTLETFSGFDFPSSRADQLQAALNYLTQQSSVRTRIDPNRTGVIGHSMGGGGTIEAARDNPALDAAVALQPWDIFQSFATVQVPTAIIGAQNDIIAGVTGHSEPFYQQIPAAAEKSYVEVAGADHFLGNSFNATQARQILSWFKRYIDDDTRYSQFLCPPPSGPTIVEYRNTCPT
jgi:predicted dienelactone hydrolase